MEQLKNKPSAEEIERRAYEIYERRGRVAGDDVSDWLSAEQELMSANEEIFRNEAFRDEPATRTANAFAAGRR